MSKQGNQYLRLIEAFIFASAEPVSKRILRGLLPENIDLESVLMSLQSDYQKRGVVLVEAGNSWSFRTAPDISRSLNKEVKKSRPPSRVATEVLAIIAYHQPITRAEIEEIRGVGLSKGTLDFLFELDWVRPKGRRKTPGRPVIWGTTDKFLDHFGLKSIRDLPGVEELKASGLLDTGPSITLYGASSDLGYKEEGETSVKFDGIPGNEDESILSAESVWEDVQTEIESLDPEAEQ